MTTNTWQSHLTYYNRGSVELFDERFLMRWGALEWARDTEDIEGATEFHVQLVSRIATQELGYSEGREITALESLRDLFIKGRAVTEGRPKAKLFEPLLWHVLNRHVRPFTAKWHLRSQAASFGALDATDEFRAELADLRKRLVLFDELLLEIRDGQRPPPDEPHERKSEVLAEVERTLESRMEPLPVPDDSLTPGTMLASERRAIMARRAHYNLPTDAPHAVALALSGGGIRSATFSLGVLIAMSRRNILPQIDYLSTVSGGGYLGAFLQTILADSATQSKDSGIGLRGDQLPFHGRGREAEAIGHIRQNSRYLASGSAWARVQVAFAQIYGLFVNLMAVAVLLGVLAAIEFALRQYLSFPGGTATTLAIAAMVVGVVAVLIPILMLSSRVKRHLDKILALAATPIVAIATWILLGDLHARFASQVAADRGLHLIWTAPLVVLALAIASGRLFPARRSLFQAVAGMSVPLFLAAAYFNLYAFLPELLARLSPGALIATAAGFLLVFLSIWWALDVNFTSLHRHYRERLAGAFLVQHGPDGRGVQRSERKLSGLASSVAAPYPIINAALNVPASRAPRMQGRLADFFIFTPDHCGSPLTGYQPTQKWENANPDLDLGTAMAISGAAAAPQMGLSSPGRMSFWLALLNIRLGYWLAKPAARPARSPGLHYLLREMFGIVDEHGAHLNLSDGGHIENLGVYELLRRRCKYIIAIDGEEDPRMTFHAMANLQRMAAIDLDVAIDIDLDDLRLNDQGLSRTHFRFSRIRYSPTEIGYLLYVKLSLTGNEGEFIRRYRLDEPDFPHHSTLNQLFSEPQFEAYRSLGEHVGEKTFLRAIVGDLADSPDVSVEAWFAKIADSLLDPRVRT